MQAFDENYEWKLRLFEYQGLYMGDDQQGLSTFEYSLREFHLPST